MSGAPPKRGRVFRRTAVALVRWVDTHAGDDAEPSFEKRVDWVRVLPFAFLHAACLGVIWVGWSPVAVAVAVLAYVVRMFAVTGIYHRYFSHRAFRLNRFWQFAFAVLGGTAVQRGPLWWAAHHRHHHRVSDQPEDVHSPVQHGFLWSHIGWLTSRHGFRTRVDEVRDLCRFPELVFLDRFDTLVPVLFAGALFGLGAALEAWAPGLGTDAWQMLVWGFFVSTVCLFHGTCTINSLAHVIGRRRYETGDHSRNSALLALITLGEGWHNNHHHYPGAARQGFFWWELDITYYALRALAVVGIVKDLRPVPAHTLESDLVRPRTVRDS
jgi:stearoyl-CoA desaturase (delta-9 desaturase)